MAEHTNILAYYVPKDYLLVNTASQATPGYFEGGGSNDEARLGSSLTETGENAV